VVDMQAPWDTVPVKESAFLSIKADLRWN
jgi:hypothetical protein